MTSLAAVLVLQFAAVFLSVALAVIAIRDHSIPKRERRTFMLFFSFLATLFFGAGILIAHHIGGH